MESVRDLERDLEDMKEYYSSGITKQVSWRKSQLEKLLILLKEKRVDIFKALKQDLGKHHVEAFRDEIGTLIKSVNYALENLKGWMSSKTAKLPIIAILSSAEVVAEPLGLVLIMSSWNFPFGLSLEPVIGAIAAGNTMVLKPSELAPASSAVLADAISTYLDNKAIKVIEGGPCVGQQLLHHKWDKIFFTGSSRVGRQVMSAAVKHLTPVTLELGGKCPAVLDSLTSSWDRELCPAACSRRAWSVAFHAVCWTTWELRNEVVFNNGNAGFERAVELVLWRIALWFKTFGLGSQVPVSVLMMNLKIGCVDKPIIRSKVERPWSQPLEGTLKFNVDGSSLGNPGPSGIGGILRNSNGEILCMFAAHIGSASSAAAEVHAILRACNLCESDSCPANVNIIIESDSMVANAWVNGTVGVGNVGLMEFILDIRDILDRCKSWLSVVHIPRSSNAAADFLAKQGAMSSLDQVVWA